MSKPKEKEPARRDTYAANYGDATPRQVADAILKYRPKDVRLSPCDAAPKSTHRQP